MKKRMLLVGAIVLPGWLGCASRPGGYTSESWARYKEEKPGFAEAIEWVANDPGREKAREALARASPLSDSIGDFASLLRLNDEAETIPLARFCMKNDGDFKAIVKIRIENRLKETLTKSARMRTEHGITVNTDDSMKSIGAHVNAAQQIEIEFKRLNGEAEREKKAAEMLR